MQPRQPRLGDVVDDYCSRCRLLSNHAIAAIVDDAIKQTRCSTCDFEHPYKDGKLPTRRSKKDGTTSALYRQVLDNVTDGMPDDTAAARPPAPKPILARTDAPRPALAASDPQTADPVPTPAPAPDSARAAAAPVTAPVAAPVAVAPVAAQPRLAPAPQPAQATPLAAAPPAAAPAAQAPAEDRDPGPEGIVHRRLIRATLPKVEGAEREPRPIPTFTVHEAATARNKFRRFPRPGGHGQGNGNGQGNANGNGMPRFGHGGPPSPFSAHPGRGQGQGPGKGGPHPNRGGGGQQGQGNRANQQQRRGPKGR